MIFVIFVQPFLLFQIDTVNTKVIKVKDISSAFSTLDFIPPAVDITASPGTISKGGTTTLNWTSIYADSAIIDNGIGTIPVNGTLDVSLTETTTYTITVSGPGGESTDSITVIVKSSKSSPDVSISSSTQTVGDSAVLSWDSSHARSVSIDHGIGEVDSNGSVLVFPSKTTTYTITATSAKGTAKESITIFRKNLPFVDLTASTTTIQAGESVTLSWSAIAEDSVYLNNGIGLVQSDDSITLTPSETSVYTIAAVTFGATASKSVTVYVDNFPPPSINISASPDTIQLGNSTVLSWNSSEADTVTIDNGVGAVALNGSQTVTPTGTTLYTATATGPGGTTTASVLVNVIFPAPTVTLQAAPNTITEGESATLSWSSTTADTASIDNGIGTVAPNGQTTVSPTSTTTYTITVTGPGGAASDSVTIVVNLPPPTAAISASPAVITVGEDTTLSWTTSHADSVSIDNGIGSVSLNGATTVSPAVTTTYTITATGPGGTSVDSTTVTVNPGPPVPTVSISASPTTITIGESSTLTWTSTNADTATIDNGIGPVSTNGNTTVTPADTTLYTITVTGPGGSVSDSVTVFVDASYAGLDGTVFDGSTSLPVEGVNVNAQDSIQTHSAVTDSSGQYSFSTLAPGDIIVSFEKEGYSPYQQNINIPADTIYDLTTYLDPVITGAILTGYVTDSLTGLPIESAVVTATYSSTSDSTTTATDGSYTLEGLPLNVVVDITVSRTGYRTESSQNTFPADGTYTLNFSLYDENAQASVSGTIFDARTISPEPGVSITHVDSGTSAASDGSGYYQLSGIPLGSQFFKISKDGFADRTIIVSITGDPFRYDIYEPMTFGSSDAIPVNSNLTGIITDLFTGEPIPNAEVRCPLNDISTTADTDGRFTFSALPAGDYPLVALGLDHKAFLQMVSVSASGAAEQDFRLYPTTRCVIEGTVTDAATGEPVRFAEVKVGDSEYLKATTEADGSYVLDGVPRGVYVVKAIHRDYEEYTSGNISVDESSPTTVDIALTRKPAVGNLEGIVTDKNSGNPVEGAVITETTTSVSTVTDSSGYYLLQDAPTGLITLMVNAAGYTQTSRTTGVKAHVDATNPTTGRFDFILDTGGGSTGNSISKVITASDGGFVTAHDFSFSIAFLERVLSDDARITVTSAPSIGSLSIQPGDTLNVDAALGTGTVKALSNLIEVKIEPLTGGNPVPTVNGFLLIAGWHSQENIDTYDIIEDTIFPFFHDGTQWTVMTVKPDEVGVDTLNNISIVFVYPYKTETGTPVDTGGVYIFTFGGVVETGSSQSAVASSGYPTNVIIYDKNELDVVNYFNTQDHPLYNPDRYPDPNALPLLLFQGWEKWSILKNVNGVDPNNTERYLQMLEDLLDATQGVYRPVAVTHNTRPGLLDIGLDVARKLHPDGLGQPLTFTGIPAEGSADSGKFPYADAFGICAGGVYARAYQVFAGDIHNMIHMAAPNHGTISLFKLERLKISSDPSNIDYFTAFYAYLTRFSPGSAQFLEYDDRMPLSLSANPLLQQLNQDIYSVPRGDLTLIAGNDSSGALGNFIHDSRPNDIIVPVESVFNHTSDKTDPPDSSLFDPLVRGEMWTKVEGFNHYNMGKEEYSITRFIDEIERGLSDWVVPRIHEGNPTLPAPERDNYLLLPTQDTAGLVKARIRVDYNVWNSSRDGLYKGKDARDIDKIAAVIYYKDGNDEWHIADSPSNGAYPDGSFKDARTIRGNSKYNDHEEFFLSADFPKIDPANPVTDVKEVRTVLVTIKPGENKVPLTPETSFGMPGGQ
jgi:hypothetical protein